MKWSLWQRIHVLERGGDGQLQYNQYHPSLLQQHDKIMIVMTISKYHPNQLSLISLLKII